MTPNGPSETSPRALSGARGVSMLSKTCYYQLHLYLSAASYDLTDAFWNVCFQSKYTRDPESFEMITLAK